MSDELVNNPQVSQAADAPRSPGLSAASGQEVHTLGSSTLYKLLEAMIQLAERNQREHKVFTQDLKSAKEDLKNGFDHFAEITQRAYQQMRKELHGEKRTSLTLLNELLDMGQDLEQIVNSRPGSEAFANGKGGGEVAALGALSRWADSVEVQYRKVQAALQRHGIFPYDAVIGSPYNPALHERVGTCRVEGMGPHLVGEQRQRGYASQQPEFVLRRPHVYVTE